MGWVLHQGNDPDGAQASFEAALRISRRSGYLFDLASASLGLACVAADLGHPRRAAELHGAVGLGRLRGGGLALVTLGQGLGRPEHGAVIADGDAIAR